MKDFKLHYHPRNNGDGSASAVFHETEDQAIKADEDMNEGWGESSAASLTIRMDANVLYFRKYDRDKKEYVWIPLEELKN